MEPEGVRRLVAGLLVVAALAACSDSSKPRTTTATSFTSGVCSSITTWGGDLVAAANAFTDDSEHLSPEGRRTRYLTAFDDQQQITDELRTELETVPPNGPSDADAIRGALLNAVGDVDQNIRDNKADAAVNVDFNFIGPRPDRLFAGTEQSLSLVLKPLDELSRTHHVDALGGGCGR
ncbi:MAG TPA: hypothetical protein VGZ52_09890 [Acidimicrobiales bacterium]|nr:hypothetical protein [Acidimicrobiales bacterium]